MKVKFIRKPTPDELIPIDDFIIEKEVVVDLKTFKRFKNAPLDDHDFIIKNKDLMYYDLDENVTHCILLKCSAKDYGFLINSEGSSYGRYVAYVPLKILE